MPQPRSHEATLRIRSLASALCFCLAAPASAEVPRVVTDFSVTASLVGLVMGEVGAPIVLLDPGADPHDYQLRPSQASAIAAADLVVWMGPELTPWLPGALDSTGETHRMALLESPGTTLRRFGAAAEDAAQASSDAPAEGGHGDTDPHAWFDPDNGALWVGLIADRLADLDPEHASTYRANASLAQTRIAALDKSIGAEFSSRPPLPSPESTRRGSAGAYPGVSPGRPRHGCCRKRAPGAPESSAKGPAQRTGNTRRPRRADRGG